MENTNIKITAKQYSNSQTTLLTKSMLIAGIAFIILGFASYGWSYFFHMNEQIQIGAGLLIFMLTLLSGMIVSILWTVNMFKSRSMPLTIVCYILFIATESIAFGWLFSLGFSNNLTWLPAIFGITGGVFLLTTIIARLASMNSILTMGKIIGATAIAMAIFLVIFLIVTIVFLTMPTQGTAIAADALMSIIMMGMALVSFLYVVIDIWQISKISQFQDNTGVDADKILPWFFGYRLLTDLVNVLFVVLLFVLRFARRV